MKIYNDFLWSHGTVNMAYMKVLHEDVQQFWLLTTMADMALITLTKVLHEDDTIILEGI